MRMENTGHRSSCELNLRVQKWVKDWRQVKQTLLTEHLLCTGNALSP